MLYKHVRYIEFLKIIGNCFESNITGVDRSDIDFHSLDSMGSV